VRFSEKLRNKLLGKKYGHKMSLIRLLISFRVCLE